MKIIFVLFSLTAALFSVAQEYKISVVNSKESRLILYDVNANGFIEGYAGNEIIFSTNDHKSVPEKAKNMKPVFARGTDNTGIGLNIEREGNSIYVKGLVPSANIKYRIKVPNQLLFECKNEMWSDTVFIRGMKNGVDISVINSIVLRNIQGAILAKVISGIIDIELTGANKSDFPISLISSSGDIDITIPETIGIRLELTTNGRVYSDFDWTKIMDKSINEKNTISYRYIKGQINGGGINLKATSSSGDIFIRKSG